MHAPTNEHAQARTVCKSSPLSHALPPARYATAKPLSALLYTSHLIRLPPLPFQRGQDFLR